MRAAEFLFQSIPLLIQLYAEQYLQHDLKNTLAELESYSSLPRVQTFDFIVVGGGSAGCVVAGRLSEKFNVLLLEAGGTPPPATEVPYFWSMVSKDPSINYFYEAVPQNISQKYGGTLKATGGKMLGGSGSHNGCTHHRGNPNDYNNWANITGDSSWNYTNVLKYFKKLEKFIGHRFGKMGKEYYGDDGPITVDTNVVPFLPLWFEAGKELGFEVEDPNGFQRESFIPLDKVVDSKGHRASSYTGYIKPFEGIRKNLTVIRYANVSEILLNERNEAYGVAYTRHGFPQIAHAAKEVILSAGSFGSPLMLMRSGIGPEDQLKAAGIPVKVPLEAVGKRLSDHFAVVLTDFQVNDTSLFPIISADQTEEVVEAFNRGEGILTLIPSGPSALVTSSKAEPGWPNYWIQFTSPSATRENNQEGSFSLAVVLGRPKSTGTIGINSKLFKAGIRDNTRLAKIEYNALSNAEDVEVLLEGIKFALQLTENTKSFQSLNTTYAAAPNKACSDHQIRTDDYWRCVITQELLAWTHMAGTCGMGSDSSASVVDSKMRVRGVRGLRVIDASIMPEVTNVNINAAVLMIGEKGADSILQAWS